MSGTDKKFSETYNNEGRVEVDEQMFDEPNIDKTQTQDLEEGEYLQETQGETQEDNTQQTENLEQDNQEQNNTQETSDSEVKLYAGKFKTEQELKNAFLNLGGDPRRYEGKTQDLEHAYEVWQSEFTRSRQHLSNLRDLEEENTGQATATMPTDEEILSQVDWSKVETVQDMGREMVKVFKGLMEQSRPQQIDIRQISEQIKDEQERSSALMFIEAESPRLKNDPEYRNLFASYINMKGGLPEGSDYKQTMQQLFRDFNKVLQVNADAQTESAKRSESVKRSNVVPKEQGDGNLQAPKKAEDDIFDGIINAHQKTVEKFGGIR